MATLARIPAVATSASWGWHRRLASYSMVVLALTLAACGSSGQTTSSVPRTAKTAARAAKPGAVKLAYRPLFSLPAAVQDPTIAPLPGGRFALLGGLDAADTSTANVTVLGLHGPQRSASLPNAQHDAQAAAQNGQVYVFGGGQFSQYDHILRFDPASGSVAAAGSLPSAESDVAVASLGGAAYIVGGFDGTKSLDTILAWSSGRRARVVGHLPVPLRYAAVANAGRALLIIGGSTPTGASDIVYRFDPASGIVRRLGRMPQPITHADAAAIGQTVYVVGGRGDSLDARSAAVWAIDPLTGRVRAAGELPQPISDAGVVSLGDAIVVAGGRTAAGTQSGVGELVPVR
ncbi:MAG: Kelch repeat-containing protein [Solirubrobacteraceae bacterium]